MEKFIESTEIRRRVLVTDDEVINREMLKMILSRDYDVDCACNGEEALNMLRQGSYSLLLLDLLMPVLDGFGVIERCAHDEQLKNVPIIVMTSEKSAEVKSIRMGAADFITKPYDMPEVILARCERIINLSESRTIISSTERDDLTGLYTRGYFFAYINRMLPNIECNMDAVVINLDRFHLVNELFGRPEGDRMLRETAGLISERLVGDKGIACRTEADSFYVFCVHRDNYEEALVDIQREIEARTVAKSVRIRAGVYKNIECGLDVESCYRRAKTACDRLRGGFGAHTEVYDNDMHEKELFDERLISDFSRSLENGEFKVYFQPKYNIEDDVPKLSSAEALVRWTHPEFGFISPGQFIPLFEKNGLIRQLDEFVWDKAAAQVKQWQDEMEFTLPVSVNVSRVDAFDPLLCQKLTDIIDRHGITRDSLLLEITESACSEDSARFIEIVNDLRKKGFKIEMDDFGSGYSSLNMLTSIPIDAIKLDMYFIRNMLTDETAFRLVKLVVDVSDFLGVPVIAEGVEKQEQLTVLKAMGCEVIQGYYFSPPKPPENITALIEKEIYDERHR